MKRIVALTLCVLMLLPLAHAVTFTPTYNQGEVEFRNLSGCRLAQATADRNGADHVYAGGCGIGRADSLARIGNTYATHSGYMLGSFSTSASFSGHEKGHLTCATLAGGTTASYTLTLQKWRLSGSSWLLEQTSQIDSESCVFFGSIDKDISGSGFFTFNPGTTYRVMVEAMASAQTFGVGEASSDFCGVCFGGTDPERTSVFSISVPNQAPASHFNDGATWWVTSIINGGAWWSGDACDIDGNVNFVETDVSSASGSSSPFSACGSASAKFNPLIPGTYGGCTSARDNENRWGSQSCGNARYQIVPGVAARPAGFPNLDSIPRTSLGPSVTIETLQKTDGTTRAYRVSSGGTVFMDTLSTATPDPTDKDVLIAYDRIASSTTVSIDGVSQWSGLVKESGTNVAWYDIVPIGDTIPYPAPQASPNSDQTYPSMETVPYDPSPPLVSSGDGSSQ